MITIGLCKDGMTPDNTVYLTLPASYREREAARKKLESLQPEGTTRIVDCISPLKEDLHSALCGMEVDQNTLYRIEALSGRLDYLMPEEHALLGKAIAMEKPDSLTELLNISYNLDKYEILPTTADGSPHEPSQGDIHRTGELEQVYRDKYSYPAASYTKGGIFDLTIRSKEGYRTIGHLSAPFSYERYQHVAGDVDRSQMRVEIRDAANVNLAHYLPVRYELFNPEQDLLTINELADIAQNYLAAGISERQIQAALLAEMPQDLESAKSIVGEAPNYKVLPAHLREPGEYGRHLVEKEKLQVDPQLVDHINYKSFGEARMRQDNLIHTEAGLVQRTDRPTPPLEAVQVMRLYSPVRVEVLQQQSEMEEYQDEPGYIMDDMEAARYVSDIQQAVRSDMRQVEADDPRVKGWELENRPPSGLARYQHNHLMQRKVISIVPDVEVVDGRLWGVTEIHAHGQLSPDEMEALQEYICGQYSDGWGEGFEQREIDLDSQEVYVHFWNRENFTFYSEQDVKPVLEQNSGPQMGL